MKYTPLAALLLLAGTTTPALADAHSEAPAKAALNIDSSIEALMADEGAKAIVLKHLPGLDQHPAFDQFKTMSLVALKPWSQGQITDEIIANITTELAALA